MKEINKLLQEQFDLISKDRVLFRSSVSGEDLWKTYLGGFNNPPKFRSMDTSIYDCNYCHSWFRQYANIVAVDKDWNIISLFDIPESKMPDEYKNSWIALRDVIKAAGISGKFVETYSYLADNKTPFESNPKTDQRSYKLGVEKNVKFYTKDDVERYPTHWLKEGDTMTFEHFWINIPRDLIDFTGRTKADLCAPWKVGMEVFKRGIEEIPVEIVENVLELEEQGSLLNGSTYVNMLKNVRQAMLEYQTIPAEKKEAWFWKKSVILGPQALFRNNVIGTLLLDLTAGELDTEEACREFNKKVDPTNYMKASAPITKKQIQEAQKFVEENGYTESLKRRCATIDDIMVSDILHSNQDAGETKTVISVFDTLKATGEKRKFDPTKVPEIGIEDFMKDVLPGCSNLELYLTANHKNNFVTLLTSEDKNSKPLFKWPNNFSWTYSGDLTGKSTITKAVKAKGGTVDAPFRFSIMWNEEGDARRCDLDAHLNISAGLGDFYHIYYGNKRVCGGELDIDIRIPGDQVAVENIFWKDRNKLVPGKYKFSINNFNGGVNRGARAELLVDGVLYSYDVPTEIKNTVDIVEVVVDGSGNIKVGKSKYSKDQFDTVENVYGLSTADFHKVSLACLSPNHWQGNGVGNKHYFFMLAGAKAPDKIRSLHNEFLIPELHKHRKVMEVLGTQLKIDSTEGQLSGLGFNSTVRDSVIVRVDNKRLIKINF